jgi:DNA polymerase-3 subunit epsilon
MSKTKDRSELRTNLMKVERDILLKYYPKGIVCVDLETTGLSPLTDRIIEIAAIKFSKSGLTKFHSLINPHIPIPPFTSNFHGIFDKDIEDSPTIEQVLFDCVDFIDDSTLIAHNALFDAGFLAKDMQLQGIDFSSSPIVDTCKFGRAVYKSIKEEDKKPKNYKLSTLCEFYKIPLSHHQAMDDTIGCLRMFAQMLLKAEEIKKEKLKVLALLEKAFLFNFDFYSKYQHQDLSKEGKQLLSVIENKQFTYIVYKGGTKGELPRKIRPIGLMPWPKGAILYAEDIEDKMNKSYIIKKIKKVLSQHDYDQEYL